MPKIVNQQTVVNVPRHITLYSIEHTEPLAELTNNHESRRLEDTEKQVNMHCNVISYKQANDCVKEEGSQISLANSYSSDFSSLVLLAAQIYVRDIYGNRQLCRALLDPLSVTSCHERIS